MAGASLVKTEERGLGAGERQQNLRLPEGRSHERETSYKTESPKNCKGEKIGQQREEAVFLPRGGCSIHLDYSRTSGASSPCLADDAGGRAKGNPEKIALVATIMA